MSKQTTRHFELLEHIGLDVDGNPEPIVEVGLTLRVPEMRGGELVIVEKPVRLEPLPGTRVVATDDPMVAAGLLDSGQYREVDTPTKRQVRAARDATTDAAHNAGTHDKE